MWFALCISMKMEKIYKKTRKRSSILESFTSARTLWSVYAKNMMMEWNSIPRPTPNIPVLFYKKIHISYRTFLLQKGLVPILNSINNLQQQSFLCFGLHWSNLKPTFSVLFFKKQSLNFSNILIDDWIWKHKSKNTQ